MENGALSERMQEKSCSKVKSMLIFVYSFISRVMRMFIGKRKRQKSRLIGKEERANKERKGRNKSEQ